MENNVESSQVSVYADDIVIKSDSAENVETSVEKLERLLNQLALFNAWGRQATLELLMAEHNVTSTPEQ